MNERYIFRAKRVDTGEWDTGYAMEFMNGGVVDGLRVKTARGGWHTVPAYPETIGQSTGLRDRAGRLVFEGDIVKLLSQDNRGIDYDEVLRIEWCDDVCGYVGMNEVLKSNDMYAPLTSHDRIEVLEMEIIGTIHDAQEEE